MKPKYNTKQEVIDALNSGAMSRRTVTNTAQYYKKRRNPERMKMFQDALADTRRLTNPWRIFEPVGNVLPLLHKKYIPVTYDEVEDLYGEILACDSYACVMRNLVKWANDTENDEQVKYKFVHTILYELHEQTLLVAKMIAKDCECGDIVGHKG